MSRHAPTLILALVCLAGLALGCQAVPPAPTDPAVRPHVTQSDGSYDDTDGDGWLWQRLFHRQAPTTEPTTEQSGPGPSSILPATAVEPLPSAEGPSPVTRIPAADDAASTKEEKEKKDEDLGFDLSDLDPENIYKNLKDMAGYGPDERIARGLFQEGQTLYQQKRYKAAAAKFKAAAGRWPDSTLEEDAMFMQGESYFFADEYPKAHDTFGNLLMKHDNSRYLDTVVLRQFSIGQYWEQVYDHSPHWPVTPNLTDSGRPLFDTWGNAIKAYEIVSMKDPTGPLADDAVMALGNTYFRRGRYEDAATYYDQLRRGYPNSKHQVQAHLLAMKSKEQIYQGPLYDGTPLEEAGEIAGQTLGQFGRQLGVEHGNVVKTRRQIQAKMAERDWAMAKFYEIKKHYGAARYYYREIIKDHPNSEMARAARGRLQEIKDFPDRPPNRFKWLTDLFPAEK